MADHVFVAQANGGDNTLTVSQVSAGVPAGTSQGHLEVILAGTAVMAPSTPPSLQTPAGWSLLGTSPVQLMQNGLLNHRRQIFGRIAPAAPAAATLSTGGTNAAIGFSRLTYTNPDAQDIAACFVKATWGGANVPASTGTVTSMDTGQPRALLLVFMAQGVAQGCTPPADMTERVDNTTFGMSAAEGLQVTQGATGNKVFTFPSNAGCSWAFAEFKGGQTFTAELGASSSVSASRAAEAQAVRAAATVCAAAAARGVQAARQAATAGATVLVRSVAAMRTASSGAAAQLATLNAKLLTLEAASAVQASASKSISAARAAASATAAAVARQVGAMRAVASACSAGLSTLKVKLLTLAASSAAGAALARASQATRGATVAGAASLQRTVSAGFAASASTAAAVAKTVGRTCSAAAATLAGLTATLASTLHASLMRMWHVVAERRWLDIPAERRVLDVPPEDRNLNP